MYSITVNGLSIIIVLCPESTWKSGIPHIPKFVRILYILFVKNLCKDTSIHSKHSHRHFAEKKSANPHVKFASEPAALRGVRNWLVFFYVKKRRSFTPEVSHSHVHHFGALQSNLPILTSSFWNCVGKIRLCEGRWFCICFKCLLSGESGASSCICCDLLCLIMQLLMIFIYGYFQSRLPSLKLTYPLKIDPWKRRVLLETTIFRCQYSFRECNSFMPFAKTECYFRPLITKSPVCYSFKRWINRRIHVFNLLFLFKNVS